MALGVNLNLTLQVVEALGTAIVSGVYGAQSPLPIESELFRQYNTSRGTLREAIKMLTAKGLIGSRPRQGTWVEPEKNWSWLDPDVLRWAHHRVLSPSLTRELAEIRLTVEPPAAAFAAMRASFRSINVIKSALSRLAAAEVGEDDPLEAELAFHVALVRAARNRFFEQFTAVTELSIRSTFRLATRLKTERGICVLDHGLIFHAVVAHDAPAAEDAVRAMIEKSMALIDRAEAEMRASDCAVSSSIARG